jgi:hypothetical protein
MGERKIMKKSRLIAVFVMAVIFVAMFSPTFPSFFKVAHASGPPPGGGSGPWQNTFYEGAGAWGPTDADPGVANTATSEELLFNTMQGLIAWNGELYWYYLPVLATNVPSLVLTTITVTSTSSVGADPTGSTWTEGTNTYTCVGWVDELPSGFGAGDVMYLTDGTSWRTWTVNTYSGGTPITLTLWRGSYEFNIRTSPTIDFYDSTGSVVAAFSIADVKYSMDWYEVTDLAGGPVPASYDKVLFDDATDHAYWSAPVSSSIHPNPLDLAHLIDNAFEVSGNSFTINVGIHYSDYDFKQILCNTWGCISSEAFDLAHGCWNGNLYATTKYGGTSPATIPPGGSRICPPLLPNCPDWYVDWADCPPTSDPVDQPLSASIYCGTGPYHVALVDPVNLLVQLNWNPGFWQGWPATLPACPLPNGVPANGSLTNVEIDYISSLIARLAKFATGNLDACADAGLTSPPSGIEYIKISAVTGFWCWYWVKGWYYDAMYPGNYYYTMWKEDNCWYDMTGYIVGVSDGVCGMKDIAYLIAHFNAKAPVLGLPVDPKWVSVYGANGCVDPYGDRVSNMKDIAGAIQHFNHHLNTGTP